MRIQPNSKLVLIGDSITDCGRAQPVGEGGGEALGNGYVSLIDALLNATSPQQCIRIINMGISGNTVRDLAARWPSDVLALEPDWLSIMIGINDVWNQFGSPLQAEWHVPRDEYARTLEDLVRTTRGRLQGLVLMTPYFLEPNRAEPMRARMDQYGAVVRELAGRYDAVFVDTRELAGRYDAVFVDTQAALDAALTHMHPMALAWDRVHLNLTGHMILARAFLTALDYNW
jgi:lysophospholipase L1-like esterase